MIPALAAEVGEATGSQAPAFQPLSVRRRRAARRVHAPLLRLQANHGTTGIQKQATLGKKKHLFYYWNWNTCKCYGTFAFLSSNFTYYCNISHTANPYKFMV